MGNYTYKISINIVEKKWVSGYEDIYVCVYMCIDICECLCVYEYIHIYICNIMLIEKKRHIHLRVVSALLSGDWLFIFMVCKP